MNDSQIQPETWTAAGRASALLLALVAFAAIWESDSSRTLTEESTVADVVPQQAQVQQNPVAVQTASSIRPNEAAIERTIKRDGGLVRISLRLESSPQTGDSRHSLSRDLVCRGDVEELRSEVLTLLAQLDVDPQPPSGRIASLPDATTRVDVNSPAVPLPRDIPSVRSAGSDNRPAVVHRGFIFLGRRPAPALAATQESDSVETKQPRILKTTLIQDASSLQK